VLNRQQQATRTNDDDKMSARVLDNNKRLFMSSRDVLKELNAIQEEGDIEISDTKTAADGSSETEKIKITRRETIIAAKKEAEIRAHHERIVWRDFTFLMFAVVVVSIMGYIETHSGDVELRGGSVEDMSDGDIMDTGFILTKRIHAYLEENRWVNDLLAAINTIIGVLGPAAYMVYQTLWVGDYEPVFRYFALSLIRSFCGFATFLPPDKSYLVSYYDFPDIAQCMIKDCGDPRDAKVQPFVSFFSGHVGKFDSSRWIRFASVVALPCTQCAVSSFTLFLQPHLL
jgi:hypothetical protein